MPAAGNRRTAGGETMTSIHANHTTTHAPPHILVMEDEETVARGLEMVLEEEGYDVDLAFTGAGALETFATRDFDLLVADLRLPDSDGLDIIRIVKERKPETEVVVITGYSSVSSAVDAMKIGVADYLPKPFTENEIKAAIGNALNRESQAGEKAERTSEKTEENLIQRREVLQVLDRTNWDVEFARNLLEGDSSALNEYVLSWAAKAAITSGDLNWLRNNVGELSDAQMIFINKRLQREAW
jgi:DNA-binding response OmpR family regulator